MEEPTLFGFALSTYRDFAAPEPELASFQFEQAIAAISILFFRTTITVKNEPWLLRTLFAFLLATMAYNKQSYELIMASELISFALPFLLGRFNKAKLPTTAAGKALWLLGSMLLSVIISHMAFSGKLRALFAVITPSFVVEGLEKLFPIQEMKAAYRILYAFSDPVVLQRQIAHLLFVTFHIQAGMGYLGINFLRTEQERRNQLLRMDIGDEHDQGEAEASTKSKPHENGGSKHDSKRTAILMERSAKYKQMAGPFILFAALPYMLQIILYGNINKFAYTCVQHDIHRNVRLHELFGHDSHLTALSIESSMSPECTLKVDRDDHWRCCSHTHFPCQRMPSRWIM